MYALPHAPSRLPFALQLDEFFLWTLGFVEQQTGTGLEDFFRRYDSSKEGILDAREFAMAAEDLGFGSAAHELFIELDPDESGGVTYHELVDYLKQSSRGRVGSVSSIAKRFLTGVAYSVAVMTEDLEPSTWNLTSTDSDGLRDELRTIMKANSAVNAPSMYAIMTLDGTETVTRKAFPNAMMRIGYPGTDPDVLNEIFHEMDMDGSGAFGMNDLHMWLHGVEGQRSKSMKLTLLRRPVEGIKETLIGANAMAYPCPLREVEWNPAALRKALQLMLLHANIAPLDLLRAWDKDVSGSFSKQEFSVMLKRIVDDPELWDDELRDVCHVAFKQTAAGDRSIDVIEFEVWLNVGWLQLKREVMGKAMPTTRTPHPQR